MQAAYNELMAGKPSILHVTGNTPQHWITIIGCKKTGGGSGISVSDLVAIDPWDGKVITVSDKYKVKTSYRLGVKVDSVVSEGLKRTDDTGNGEDCTL